MGANIWDNHHHQQAELQETDESIWHDEGDENKSWEEEFEEISDEEDYSGTVRNG